MRDDGRELNSRRQPPRDHTRKQASHTQSWRPAQRGRGCGRTQRDRVSAPGLALRAPGQHGAALKLSSTAGTDSHRRAEVRRAAHGVLTAGTRAGNRHPRPCAPPRATAFLEIHPNETFAYACETHTEGPTAHSLAPPRATARRAAVRQARPHSETAPGSGQRTTTRLRLSPT